MEPINTNANAAATEQKEEKKRIVIDVHEPFDSVGDLKITNTEELASLINDLFKPIFKDYYGCKLITQFIPERGSAIIASLVFSVLHDSQYNGNTTTAFKPLSSDKDSNFVNRVQRLSQIAATPGVKVSMNSDAQEMLEEFLITPNKNQKIDWESCYRSHVTESGTFIELFKIDVTKIVKKIYGSHDKFGSEYFYQVTPTYKLNTTVQYNGYDNWVMNILRLNQNNEIAAAKLLGMYYSPEAKLNVITTTSNK